MSDATAKALRLLGLAAKAGKLTVGTDLVCAALARGGEHAPRLAVEAGDSSNNTHKRVTDRCAYYGVRALRLSAAAAELAHAIGKRDAAVAVVGVSDPHLAAAIIAALEKETL